MNYKLVGYDHTERIADAYVIPEDQVELVKRIAGLCFRPGVVGDWPLKTNQAVTIGEIIDKPIQRNYDYFLEPYAA